MNVMDRMAGGGRGPVLACVFGASFYFSGPGFHLSFKKENPEMNVAMLCCFCAGIFADAPITNFPPVY